LSSYSHPFLLFCGVLGSYSNPFLCFVVFLGSYSHHWALFCGVLGQLQLQPSPMRGHIGHPKASQRDLENQPVL
jgi:hypothetical protein